ncbi:thioredoxin domain-containing protein [Streptosporangium sp. V21-05]|uniref:DsbA family protein n=1 Tax=Streptosporangium sp. V21-05 TaxID=3446115 RepID=UPI003F52BA9C
MSTRPQRATAPARVPAGASADGDGIVVGTGPVTVDVYVDFLCPYCRSFEQASGPALNAMVKDRTISLVCHPTGFLDRLSADRYSSRASAASGCASDGGRFVEYTRALFAGQPPEGGPGLTDDELIELGGPAGLGGPAFGEGVRDGTYLDWTAYVTRKAVERGVSATPTVLVEGIPVQTDPQAIVAAVAAVAP